MELKVISRKICTCNEQFGVKSKEGFKGEFNVSLMHFRINEKYIRRFNFVDGNGYVLIKVMYLEFRDVIFIN